MNIIGISWNNNIQQSTTMGYSGYDTQRLFVAKQSAASGPDTMRKSVQRDPRSKWIR